jgi:hypothetical protein
LLLVVGVSFWFGRGVHFTLLSLNVYFDQSGVGLLLVCHIFLFDGLLWLGWFFFFLFFGQLLVGVH